MNMFTALSRKICQNGYFAAFVIFSLFAIPSEAKLYQYAIIGDAGMWNSESRIVRDSILKSGVSDLMLPGDNLYDLTLSYEDVWKNWWETGLRAPVVALGNHLRNYSEEIEYFRMPGEFYSQVQEDLRIIVLNSDNTKNVTEQMRFLESELKAATEPLLFIVSHHPPYTISRRHSWMEKREFQTQLRKLLSRYSEKITALIVGHDHIASLVTLDQVPMIVSGAVFEQIPTRPVDYRENGVQVSTQWLFQTGPFWAKLDAETSTGEVWVNFIRADAHKTHCSARIHPRPLFLKNNCKQFGSKAVGFR